ncbi:hypothetical protein PMSD_23495 [Paenibacillus macquariensis subsp. defensor]|nr:hypothetical protein PMSD_23495 [Paenibacillus macquariensis subsp. defensor]
MKAELIDSASGILKCYEGIYLTNKSSKSVQLFLSALKNFYKTMIRMGMYVEANPLTDLEFDNNLSDRQGVRPNRPRVFQAVGTEEPMEYRRQTDSYFKIINEEWYLKFKHRFGLKILKTGLNMGQVHQLIANVTSEMPMIYARKIQKESFQIDN